MISAREPLIIQGGMGVGVSGWKLARAVSLAGQLGVVSGTAIDVVMARRLQRGDAGGHVRRALAEFPYSEMADRILQRYFVPGGKANDEPFRATPLPALEPTPEAVELLVAANFVEVHLAAEGHDGVVGVNYLEKIQTPTLASLYGAMLAGVDYVLMGAGIPRAIPGVLDRLSRGEAVELPVAVAGGEAALMRFDPEEFGAGPPPTFMRPRFLAIVASATLASMLARKASGRVDGFVVEGPTAGGHNAPPRGAVGYNNRGEPLYSERDAIDLAAMRALNLPFWLAGSYGSPEQVTAAVNAGAAGVQVGTAFAFCAESGLPDDVKRRVLALSRTGALDVFADALASPTGFPFKVLQLDGTLAAAGAYAERTRVCDVGFLRQAYRRGDGTVGWRCPGERCESFVQKGGAAEETAGRKCLCNALLSNIGLGQVRAEGYVEPPLFTSGDDVNRIAQFAPPEQDAPYSALDVVRRLTAKAPVIAVPTVV
jgi:nitronate monooxygenase